MSSQVDTSIKKPLVYLITIAQLAVLLPLVLVLCFILPEKGFAAFVGVSIELTGRAYFGFYAFRYVGAQRVSLVLKSFRRGELGKFVIVAIMFGVSFFIWPDINLPTLYVGYLVSWFLGAVLSFRILK